MRNEATRPHKSGKLSFNYSRRSKKLFLLRISWKPPEGRRNARDISSLQSFSLEALVERREKEIFGETILRKTTIV
jgi:hypothetical protein